MTYRIRICAIYCVMAIAAIVSPALAAGETVDFEKRDADLVKLLPDSRKPILERMGPENRRFFLFYAASLPILAVIPENTALLEANWILPSEMTAVSGWSSEMRASLAQQRFETAHTDVHLSSSASAEAALDAMKKAYKEIPPSEPGLDKYMLAYDLIYSQYLKARVIDFGKPLPKSVRGDEAAVGEKNKEVFDISAQEASVILDILRVLRRTDGILPDKRADAAKRIGENMVKLSPGVLEGLSPTIYYDIGRMYWSGWGKDTTRDVEQAKKYFAQAVKAFKGKVSLEYLSYATTLSNLSRDNPTEMIALVLRVEKFMKFGTEDDVFGYLPMDTAAKTRMLYMGGSNRKMAMIAVRENAQSFIDIVTDNGTLKRFSGNPESLKMISDALKETKLGTTASDILKSLTTP